MRKQIILSALLLFSIISLAQSVNTEVPITSLDRFELGKRRNLISITLNNLASYNSKVSIIQSEDSISASNLKLMDSTFDDCILTFEDDRVCTISFTKYSYSQHQISYEFSVLLNILEETYGKQSPVGNKEYTWRNGQEYIRIIKEYNSVKNKESIKIICSTDDLSSLLANDKRNMYGLGSLRFFASVSEVETALKNHITYNTKIAREKNIYSEVEKIILTDVVLAGYLFNYCELRFEDNELRYIMFHKYFYKRNKNPKEFEDLLIILEKDYGEIKDKDNRESFAWHFRNDTLGWVCLTKSYDKDSKRTTIIVDASASIW